MHTIINGVNVDETTTLTFVDNPKRKGSKAYKRYAAYARCTTWADYIKRADSKYALPDARHDHLHGFVKFNLVEMKTL